MAVRSAPDQPEQPEHDLMRWGIVMAATLVLAVAAGGRFLVGIVFDQISEGFSVNHSVLALVVSLNVLVVGFIQPGVGWLVDHLAARIVTAVGLALFAFGLMITGSAGSLAELFFGYGAVAALGMAAVSPVAVTPLVAGWFTHRRATALSIVHAGSSIGQLAVVPGLTAMVAVMGWRDAYIVLGIGLLVVGAPLILWLLRERPVAGQDDVELLGCSVRAAARAWSFWQLGIGFFVCGLTMSWVMTFFVDFALGQGISREAAAAGLSLMGGMSIAGSLLTGWWADRVGRRIPLAVVYSLRGVGFALVLMAGGNVIYLFGALAVIGFSWSATVPLTSAICADLYGRRSLGTVFGLMFAIMPIGAAVGSALGGYLYDLTGSYDLSILLNLGAGLVASAAVALMRSTPLFHSGREPEPAGVVVS